VEQGSNGQVVAVTGSTGFVGRHVVRELLSHGHGVRALVRDRAKARRVLGHDDGLELVSGDVLGAGVCDRLVQGATAVIHLIGIIREASGGQTFERIHVGATRAMVEACEAAGVRRYVQMSALGVSDEGACDYHRTKFEAEQVVRRSSLDWTIFRPGLIHGPGGEFVELARGWVSGKAPPWRFIPYFQRGEPQPGVWLGAIRKIDPEVQPVSVEDVAWCFAEALDREVSIGEIYPLAGPDVLSFPDMLRVFRDAFPEGDPEIEPQGILGSNAAFAAKAAKLLGLGQLVPFDEGMAIMGAQDSVASLDKVSAHFGLSPKPFEPTVRAYAQG